LEYDEDKKVPLFGFGARYKNMVSHCFPMNQNDFDPEVQGLQGIKDTYRSILNQIAFAGPTLMEPLLKNSIRFIQDDLQKSENLKYYILLVLTDGDIHDM